LTDINNFYVSGNGNECHPQVSYLLIYCSCDVNIWRHCHIRDINELQQRLLHVWRGLEQSLIDDAVDQWPTHLRTCVRANGGHFEQTYLVTVSLFSLYLMKFMFCTTLDAVGNILRVRWTCFSCMWKNVLPDYSSAKIIF